MNIFNPNKNDHDCMMNFSIYKNEMDFPAEIKKI